MSRGQRQVPRLFIVLIEREDLISELHVEAFRLTEGRKVSTTGWTTSVTLKLTPALTATGESAQASRLFSSTSRNQGTTRFRRICSFIAQSRPESARRVAQS